MPVGKYTYGSPLVLWDTEANLTVGNFCSIGPGVTIYLGGNHRVDWISTYPFGHIHQDVFTTFDGVGHPSTKGDVIIGNDVWICSNATIMSGVTIGDGAIIANNSHVVKDVEPYTVVGGNPAKFIKHRFNPHQIAELLKIKWWSWDDEKINQAAPLLCSQNIDTFINSFRVDS